MSRHHRCLHAGRWARVRKAALRRAGYRSELSGLAGRLECHHRVRLEDGGDAYDIDNVIVLLRSEHIDLHRRESEVPGKSAWRAFVRELI